MVTGATRIAFHNVTRGMVCVMDSDGTDVTQVHSDRCSVYAL